MTPLSIPSAALRIGAVALAIPLIIGISPASAATENADAAPVRRTDAGAAWSWPTASHRVVAAYLAPPHRYGPGHRGIDIAAPVGTTLTAPADGVVAFAGSVAGRPLVTIAHDGGVVSTLEPAIPDVTTGESVRAGDRIATVGVGGHAASGTVHLGARRDGEYVNPLLLLGGVPHAVLLPCCEEAPPAQARG